MKKIAIILPRPTKRIVGGFKVAYDYANYLAKKGFNVSIVYDCHEIGTRYSLRYSLIKRLWGKVLYKQAKWFALDKHIHINFIGDSSELEKKDFDLIIATAVNTVKTIENKKLPKMKKAYFIQDFENWNICNQFVLDTYKNNFEKIVVSKWLYNIVKQYNDEKNIYYCPNGIDDSIFFVDKRIEDRNAYSICFMYHEDDRKGIKTLIPVMKRLREEYPQIIINSFGAYNKPNYIDIDNYIAYADKYMLHDMYNNSAIFICSSYEEGFGLTGAESMACGCALVTTDTNGSREYANEDNAMICKVKDENDMYMKVKSLLDNHDELHRLANNGASDIRRMSLKNAQQRFEGIIYDILEK